MTEITAEIDLIGMARKIDRIEQAVLGNGVPGLCQRVTALETSDSKRNKVTGFAAGFGIVIGSVITYVVQYFKG